MGRIVAVLVVAVMLAGCGSTQRSEMPTSLAPHSEPPETSIAAAPPPPAAAPCSQAPAGFVDLINKSFTGGETLGNAQSVTGPKDMVYVGGNILHGSELISSGDVWLAQHGALYALSSDARKRTLLPDGRDLASAGDQYGSALVDCVAR
ncbi:hypothetical protein [Mycolicibacterium komossense]|uniref:Lipoprotein n=1 Tax=Mycolicibacterium komossense TaxID=1779 RepID=A0ABT3CMK0_9MYCO|nr:hypothetical protein [Mycolicibacterium komossense]MCV7230647.1 hypothetical protein [Mycolicibacterium komossense]